MDVLDDHSRVLVAARVCSGPTTAAAWDALAHGIAEWGQPARLMSDNGACFTSRLGWGGENDFERSLRALGIHHIPSTPAHPQTCGKLERSHQTTKRWLAAIGPAATPQALQAQLDDWRRHYNQQRPHRAARGATPLEKWQATTPAQPAGQLAAPPRATLHSVAATGTISWRRFTIAIDGRLAGQHLLVVARDLDLTIHTNSGTIIRQLTIDPTRRYQPNGRPTGPRRDPLLSAMSR